MLSRKQNAVDEINQIFRQTGIGYYLTPFVEREKETEAWIVPGWKKKGIAKEYEYPKAVRSADVLIQQSITEPTLTLLSDARLKVANSEMLQAQKALRAGEYDDAITLSASAFESLLKTICDIAEGAPEVGAATNRPATAPMVPVIPAQISPIRSPRKERLQVAA